MFLLDGIFKKDNFTECFWKKSNDFWRNVSIPGNNQLSQVRISTFSSYGQEIIIFEENRKYLLINCNLGSIVWYEQVCLNNFFWLRMRWARGNLRGRNRCRKLQQPW